MERCGRAARGLGCGWSGPRPEEAAEAPPSSPQVTPLNPGTRAEGQSQPDQPGTRSHSAPSLQRPRQLKPPTPKDPRPACERKMPRHSAHLLSVGARELAAERLVLTPCPGVPTWPEAPRTPGSTSSWCERVFLLMCATYEPTGLCVCACPQTCRGMRRALRPLTRRHLGICPMGTLPQCLGRCPSVCVAPGHSGDPPWGHVFPRVWLGVQWVSAHELLHIQHCSWEDVGERVPAHPRGPPALSMSLWAGGQRPPEWLSRGRGWEQQEGSWGKASFPRGLGSARWQPRPVWLAGGGRRQGPWRPAGGGTTADPLAYNGGLRQRLGTTATPDSCEAAGRGLRPRCRPRARPLRAGSQAAPR